MLIARYLFAVALTLSTIGLGCTFRRAVTPASQPSVDVAAVEPVTWETWPTMFHGNQGQTVPLCFTSDGQFVIGGGLDGTIREWDWRARKEVGQFVWRSTDPVKSVLSVDISPDGRTLVSSAQDGTVRLWDLKTRRQTNSFVEPDAHNPFVAFSPDGASLAVAEYGGVAIIDAATSKRIGWLPARNVTFYETRSSQRGGRVAGAGGEYGAFVWDLKTGRRLARFSTGPATSDPDTDALDSRGPDDPRPDNTWMLDLSPDGTKVAIAFGLEFQVRDVDSGKLLYRLQFKDGEEYFEGTALMGEVRFSPDGRSLLLAGGGGSIWLLRTRDWTVLHKYIADSQGLETKAKEISQGRIDPLLGPPDITRTAFSPDGHRFAAATNDGDIYIYELPPIPQ
jgi:WD40 repeat protein